jgi:hypothetical protein
MQNRRRAAALGGTGAAIAALGATVDRHQTVAGMPGDFWIGLAIGLALTLAIAGAILMRRGSRDFG